MRFTLLFPDIDECLMQKHDCDKNAKCINTEPGFKCQCKPGFKEYDNGRTCKGNVIFSVTDFVGFFSSSHSVHFSNVLESFCCFFIDLNECSNKFVCAKHAKCTNLPGSYKCECNPGYSGDGKYCNGTMFV